MDCTKKGRNGMISAAKVRGKTSLKLSYDKFLYKKWLIGIEDEIKKQMKASLLVTCIKYQLSYAEWHIGNGHGRCIMHKHSPNTYIMLLQQLRKLGYKANIQREILVGSRKPLDFENDYIYVSW